MYVAVLFVVNIVFMSRFLPVIWWIFGIVEVIGFFYFSNKLTKKWADFKEKTFEKKVFRTSLIIRLIWVMFSYVFYNYMTGEPYEFHAADVYTYQAAASGLAKQGFDSYESVFWGMDVSDRGYATYLGVLYMVFGNGLIIPRVIKAVLGSISAILIYRLASRNFGDNVGRISAIFYMLMPNLIYYTGSHLKEAEMVFIVVAFLERSDYLLRTKKYNVFNIALPLVLAGILFFFRTVLGATALFALITTLMVSSDKLLGMGKRMMLIVWVLLAMAYFAGGKISTEIEAIWAARSENQSSSMEWRAERKGGNKFAKYAGASVFAPMIFALPFPTIVNTPDQENQQLLHGGNYVKNMMAFFVIFSIIMVFKQKKWRDHVLILVFTIGYLGVIAMSAFAQSERFHQPIMPLLMVLAAYGVSLVTNKTKKYFSWYTIFLFVVIVGWSWFKLAGRGMV